MRRFRRLPVLGCFVLLGVLPMVTGGCGRSTAPAVIRQELSVQKPGAAPSVEITHQNLSMAKKFKENPTSEYILGAEDEIEISVFRHDELKLKNEISQTGKINYFLVGDIEASGLTQFQLRDKVQRALSRFVKNPKVVIRITQYRSHKVYILGQVKTPGMYRIKNGYTLVEGLSRAGGITREAYLDGAYIVRQGKILLVNFYELIVKGNTDENIPLADGDLVYIPDNRDQKVYVLGEVNRQSAVSVRNGLNLLGAIAEAGGFTRDAKKNSLIVMRGNLSKPEIMKINVESMDPSVNITLERGDIIYVASSTIANVERMALRLYNILQPFYNVTRSVVWGNAAVGVMEGKDSRLVIQE